MGTSKSSQLWSYYKKISGRAISSFDWMGCLLTDILLVCKNGTFCALSKMEIRPESKYSDTQFLQNQIRCISNQDTRLAWQETTAVATFCRPICRTALQPSQSAWTPYRLRAKRAWGDILLPHDLPLICRNEVIYEIFQTKFVLELSNQVEVKNIVSSIASEGKKVNEAAFFMLPCPVGGHGSGTH